MNINEERNCFVAQCEVRRNDSPLGLHSAPHTFKKSDIFPSFKIHKLLAKWGYGIRIFLPKNNTSKHILLQKSTSPKYVTSDLVLSLSWIFQMSLTLLILWVQNGSSFLDEPLCCPPETLQMFAVHLASTKMHTHEMLLGNSVIKVIMFVIVINLMNKDTVAQFWYIK